MIAARWKKLSFGLFLSMLLLSYIGLNALPLWLIADMVVAEPDTAQVFYSSNASWTEDHSEKRELNPGLNRVAFRLSIPYAGKFARFDPGSSQREYHIVALRWYRGAMSEDVPLDAVSSPFQDGTSTRIMGGRLEIKAVGNDSQLLVPLPGYAWRLASIAWPWGLIAIIVSALLIAVQRNRIGALGATKICLGLCSAVYCLLFAKFGPMLPVFDDWRYVLSGPFSLIDGHWQWLKAVGNDTYFLTGQIIDFAVLKLSNVDFAWLRSSALALLLFHVWLTQRIVARGAANDLAAIVGIALIAWMFSTNSYWGGTAIAYHQFLPSLCGSLMLAHLIQKGGEFRERWSATLLLVASVASGLAYISGALLIVALAIALMLTAADFVRRPMVSPMVRAGVWLLVLGAGLLSLQLYLVNHQQGSLLEHTHASATVYPTDRRFWLFVGGLFGRAFGYAGYDLRINFVLMVIALTPTVFLGVERLWNGGVLNRPCKNPTRVLLALYAGIGAVAYASAVAFGRAGLAAADAPAENIVWVSKARFHYWTITAMLPFFWLGWVDLAARVRGNLRGLVVTTAALVMLLPKSVAPWDWVAGFRLIADATVNGAHCIAAQFAGAAGPVVCQSMTGLPIDMTVPLQRLRDNDRALYRDIERYLELPPPP